MKDHNIQQLIKRLDFLQQSNINPIMGEGLILITINRIQANVQRYQNLTPTQLLQLANILNTEAKSIAEYLIGEGLIQQKTKEKPTYTG